MAHSGIHAEGRLPRLGARPRVTFLSYDPRDSDQAEKFLARHASTLGQVRTVGIAPGDPLDDVADDATIIDEIRRRYLSDASIGLVLVGPSTWTRRFVDWEIAAAATHGCGLLALTLEPAAFPIPARLTLLAETRRAAVHTRPPVDGNELASWIDAAMVGAASPLHPERAANTPLMRHDVSAGT